VTNPTDKPKPPRRRRSAGLPAAISTGAVAAKASPKSTVRPAKVDTRSGAMRMAKFAVGQVVRHRIYPFRGVIFDIDPVFNNTEEWWLSIPPELRPRKDQPFYHLLAENAETEYIAYVSEQNLLPDETGIKPRHSQIKEMFRESQNGQLQPRFIQPH